MQTDKINQLVQRQNERREEETLHAAEQIIEKIVEFQKQKARADQCISELRDELKALEATTINANDIVGN